METGYKSLRNRDKKLVRQRTRKRTQRERAVPNKVTARVEKQLAARRAMQPAPSGKLAVEEMDVEIAAFEELAQALYPWDAEGKPISGKSVQAYYWASEMRRDYLSLRAPYQSPRLSAVQVIQNQQGNRVTEVNVTILNEKGDTEYSDVPDDTKLIEGTVGQEPTMGQEDTVPQEPTKDQSDEAA